MARTGVRFGRYEVARHLGTGGMGEVFLCRQSGIGGFDRLVVVKRVRPDRLAQASFGAMFLEEARIAANLNHSNVVQIHEVELVAGVPQIAMEYVRGPTLAGLIYEARQRGRIAPAHAAKIMSGVTSGLHYAHTARDADGVPLSIVHRDLSPQNVIVSVEGVPKLLDFGVARARGQVETDGGALRGRIRFLAPELLDGQPADARSDIFAAGACLYEAATGHRLYEAPTEPELLSLVRRGIYRPATEVVADFPPALERIAAWALERDPARRCPTARDLHEALEDFVREGPFASSTRAVSEYVAELFPGAGEGLFDDGTVAFRPRTPSRRSNSPDRSASRPGSSPGGEARSPGSPLFEDEPLVDAAGPATFPAPGPIDDDAVTPAAPRTAAELQGIEAAARVAEEVSQRFFVATRALLAEQEAASARAASSSNAENAPASEVAPGTSEAAPAMAEVALVSEATPGAREVPADMPGAAAGGSSSRRRLGIAIGGAVFVVALVGAASWRSASSRRHQRLDGTPGNGSAPAETMGSSLAQPIAAPAAAPAASPPSPPRPADPGAGVEPAARVASAAPPPSTAEVAPAMAVAPAAPEENAGPARLAPRTHHVEARVATVTTPRAAVATQKAARADAATVPVAVVDPPAAATAATTSDQAKRATSGGPPSATAPDSSVRLPRSYRVVRARDLSRVLSAVETEATAEGRAPADQGIGATAPLQALLEAELARTGEVELYPRSMFDAILREAGRRPGAAAIGKQLVDEHLRLRKRQARP